MQGAGHGWFMAGSLTATASAADNHHLLRCETVTAGAFVTRRKKARYHQGAPIGAGKKRLSHIQSPRLVRAH
jgi:hypothetical protein